MSYAALGLAVALMSATTAALQTPVGFWVDRYGARPFLIGGTLLMALSVAAMGLAPTFPVILALAVLSGVGNSVIHPADYAILAGSIDKGFMGRAFALHTFTGNLGFALAPPAIALMLAFMDWRAALLLVGLLGVPVVGAILLQSRVLHDQPKPRRQEATGPTGRALLLSRPMLLFFAFFLLSAMAGSGVQAWLVTVLGKLWGTPVLVASSALTGYMVGATAGTLVGGWIADRTRRGLLGTVVLLTVAAMALLLAAGVRGAAGRAPFGGGGAGRAGARHLAHAARRDAARRLAAGRGRQGVRLRLGRAAARLRHHAGAAGPADRPRLPATGAAGGGGVPGPVPALRRRGRGRRAGGEAAAARQQVAAAPAE